MAPRSRVDGRRETDGGGGGAVAETPGGLGFNDVAAADNFATTTTATSAAPSSSSPSIHAGPAVAVAVRKPGAIDVDSVETGRSGGRRSSEEEEDGIDRRSALENVGGVDAAIGMPGTDEETMVGSDSPPACHHIGGDDTNYSAFNNVGGADAAIGMPGTEETIGSDSPPACHHVSGDDTNYSAFKNVGGADAAIRMPGTEETMGSNSPPGCHHTSGDDTNYSAFKNVGGADAAIGMPGTEETIGSDSPPACHHVSGDDTNYSAFKNVGGANAAIRILATEETIGSNLPPACHHISGTNYSAFKNVGGADAAIRMLGTGETIAGSDSPPACHHIGGDDTKHSAFNNVGGAGAAIRMLGTEETMGSNSPPACHHSSGDDTNYSAFNNVGGADAAIRMLGTEETIGSDSPPACHHISGDDTNYSAFNNVAAIRTLGTEETMSSNSPPAWHHISGDDTKYSSFNNVCGADGAIRMPRTGETMGSDSPPASHHISGDDTNCATTGAGGFSMGKEVPFGETFSSLLHLLAARVVRGFLAESFLCNRPSRRLPRQRGWPPLMAVVQTRRATIRSPRSAVHSSLRHSGPTRRQWSGTVLLARCCCLLFLSCGVFPAAAAAAEAKPPFGHYDRMRFDNTTVHGGRSGNVDLVIDGNDGTEHALCHLFGLFRFTSSSSLNRAKQNTSNHGAGVGIGTGDGQNVSSTTTTPSPTTRAVISGEATYQDLAASLLAMHHFNVGDGSVVPELRGINDRCLVRFTSEIHDTGGSIVTGLRALTEAVTREYVVAASSSGGEERDGSEGGEEASPYSSVAPCAVLGAYRSSVTGPTATLANVHSIPQTSFFSTSIRLNDGVQFPHFNRVLPSDEATAASSVRYLTQFNNARHVAVIYVNDVFGDAFQKSFALEAQLFTRDNAARGVRDPMLVQSFPLELDFTDDEVRYVVSEVANLGYRYVLCAIFMDEQYEALMTEADRVGIVGPDYSWLFVGNPSEFVRRARYPPGSALARATSGIGMLQMRGGHPGMFGHDAFVESWRRAGETKPGMDGGGGGEEEEEEEEADDAAAAARASPPPSFARYVNSKMPPSTGDVEYFRADDGYFGRTDPGLVAPFAYDAVVAMGLAACRASSPPSSATNITGRDDGSSPTSPSSSSAFLTGPDMASAVVHGDDFVGASGPVRMDADTRSRVPESSFFALFNAMPNEGLTTNGADGNDDGYMTYTVRETAMLVPNENGTEWGRVWKEEFVFADGTTTPPPDLPPRTVNMNQIGPLAIVGYILCSVVLLLSVGFAAWTYRYRGVRVVRASQPTFLVMICAGTTLMGSAMITLGIDDGGHSPAACSVACMATPWLVAVGFVTAFSALFSKTWRINKIFHNPSRFKRIKVTERDVIVPFVALLAVNVTALACWTALAPLRWGRIAHNGTDQFDRTISSYGNCASISDKPYVWRGVPIPFLLIIGGANLATVILANVQAYRARNICTEYSESRYIAIVMASLLQIWIIGIPVQFLVYQIPVAQYVVRVFLIFFTCLSILLFIFVPKIIFAKEYKAQQKRKKAIKREARIAAGQTPSTMSSTGMTSVDDGESGLKIVVLNSVIGQDDTLVRNGDDEEGEEGGERKAPALAMIQEEILTRDRNVPALAA